MPRVRARRQAVTPSAYLAERSARTATDACRAFTMSYAASLSMIPYLQSYQLLSMYTLPTARHCQAQIKIP